MQAGDPQALSLCRHPAEQGVCAGVTLTSSEDAAQKSIDQGHAQVPPKLREQQHLTLTSAVVHCIKPLYISPTETSVPDLSSAEPRETDITSVGRSRLLCTEYRCENLT